MTQHSMPKISTIETELDSRTREELEFFRTLHTYKEYQELFIIQEKALLPSDMSEEEKVTEISLSNADWRLLKLRRLGNLVEQTDSRKYIITEAGETALASGKYHALAVDGKVMPIKMAVNLARDGLLPTVASLRPKVAPLIAASAQVQVMSEQEGKARAEELNKTATYVENKVSKTITQFTTAPNGVRIMPINDSNYVVTSATKYIETGVELMKMRGHMNISEPYCITGPAGVGKTTLPVQLAFRDKHPLVTMNCHNFTDAGDLIGKFVFHGGETPYLLGVLPTALELANRYGSCILALEEVNALVPEAQKILNSVLDFRRDVEVIALNKRYALNENAKLLVVGTMNYGAGYQGVSEMNFDLQRRFTDDWVEYYTPDVEETIVQEHWNMNKVTLGKDLLQSLIFVCNEIRASEEFSYKPSVSDLIKLGRLYEAYNVEFCKGATTDTQKKKMEKKALEEAIRGTIVNRYRDGATRKLVVQRIQNKVPLSFK